MIRRILLTATLLLAVALPAASAEEQLPFKDLGSAGGMALCDGKGNPITSGGVDDQPFIWKAVSEVKAPAPYHGAGQSASLYTYQPRRDAYPDQWNGDSMSAASEYPQGERPATAGTQVDPPLSSFLTAYPATWDNLVQLRMYWGARGQGFDGRRYATAVIKVEGKRWRLVSKQVGGCKDSSAISTEITIAKINTTPTPRPGATAGSTTAGAGQPGSQPAALTSAQALARAEEERAARVSQSASWGQVLTKAALLLGAATVLALVISRLRRRRS